MRIGVNSVFLVPGRVGGSETYVIDTLRHAVPLRRDVEWVLFTNAENDGLLRERFGSEPNVSCEALGVRASGKLARMVGEQTALPLACRRRAVDVLWSPGYTAPLAGGFAQVVSVLDMQYCEFPADFSLLARLALRFIVPRVARRSRTVLTLSAFSRDQIVRYAHVPSERIRVVHLGVDAVFATAMSEEEREARVSRYVPPDPYVLCVANTHPHKNVAALVQAFGRLTGGAAVRLVLVGVEGRGEAAVQAAIRASASGARIVRLAGLSRLDLVALYQGARCFAFPSLYEGFGLPVLEALAARVPTIAVRCGPLAEIGGDAVRYTDGSAGDLARALAEILAFPEAVRREWIARGARRAAEFTWARTARETLDCLLEAGGLRAE